MAKRIWSALDDAFRNYLLDYKSCSHQKTHKHIHTHANTYTY